LVPIFWNPQKIQAVQGERVGTPSLAHAVLPAGVKKKPTDSTVMLGLAATTARHFRTHHPVPFGSQVNQTRTGKVVAVALNRVVSNCDPTAHAEVRAIRLACRKIGRPNLKGYTLYTTCEPCPMCLAAALFCGLDRVVYGAVLAPPGSTRPPLYPYGAKAFAESSLFPTRVDGPVEEAACRALIDDPRPQAYMDRQWKRGVFI
jgi:tRNA(Arg) A34 adenosine deaminase TadA